MKASYISALTAKKSSKSTGKSSKLTRQKTLEEENSILLEPDEEKRNQIIKDMGLFSIMPLKPDYQSTGRRFLYDWSNQDTLREIHLRLKPREELQREKEIFEKKMKLENEKRKKAEMLEKRLFVSTAAQDLPAIPGFDENKSFDPEEEPTYLPEDDEDLLEIDISIKQFLEVEYDAWSHLKPPPIPQDNLFMEPFERMGRFSVMPPKVLYEANKKAKEESLAASVVPRPPMKIPKYWILRSKRPDFEIRTFLSLQILTDETNKELDSLGVKINEKILNGYKGSRGQIIGSLIEKPRKPNSSFYASRPANRQKPKAKRRPDKSKQNPIPSVSFEYEDSRSQHRITGLIEKFGGDFSTSSSHQLQEGQLKLINPRTVDDILWDKHITDQGKAKKGIVIATFTSVDEPQKLTPNTGIPMRVLKFDEEAIEQDTLLERKRNYEAMKRKRIDETEKYFNYLKETGNYIPLIPLRISEDPMERFITRNQMAHNHSNTFGKDSHMYAKYDHATKQVGFRGNPQNHNQRSKTHEKHNFNRKPAEVEKQHKINLEYNRYENKGKPRLAESISVDPEQITLDLDSLPASLTYKKPYEPPQMPTIDRDQFGKVVSKEHLENSRIEQHKRMNKRSESQDSRPQSANSFIYDENGYPIGRRKDEAKIKHIFDNNERSIRDIGSDPNWLHTIYNTKPENEKERKLRNQKRTNYNSENYYKELLLHVNEKSLSKEADKLAGLVASMVRRKIQLKKNY